jgi:hypothetical protein
MRTGRTTTTTTTAATIGREAGGGTDGDIGSSPRRCRWARPPSARIEYTSP